MHENKYNVNLLIKTLLYSANSGQNPKEYLQKKTTEKRNY